MVESMNLITAQISFLSPRLVLLHIPNQFYHFFIQPLFRILFSEGSDQGTVKTAWTDRHVFLNFSITPVSCSLICSKLLVDRYFRPVVDQFNALLTASKSLGKVSKVEISDEEYIAIQVEGQGLDAGQRVLELTAPLAMSGISLFFITTYFSDYVLVPVRARQTVVTTLQQRGFVFSAEAEAYVSQLSPILNHNSSSPLQDRLHTASSGNSDSQIPRPNSIPTTPPAKDIPELQTRTFNKLVRNEIEPIVNRNLRLISCAGSRTADIESLQCLKDDLMQILLECSPSSTVSRRSKLSDNALLGLGIHESKPNGRTNSSASYLSLTLSDEPISILMEEELLPRLGSTLLTSRDEGDVLTPIILDLRKLGWQATGIIGGVAGRLSQGDKHFELDYSNASGDSIDVSFLSSAKAASVLVQANQLENALKALELGLKEAKS